MGAKVSASTSEISTAMLTTRPNELRNWPIRPPTKATGRKTETIVSDMAMTGSATSAVPWLDASLGVLPISMWRKMFSRTTMASSMIRPTERVMANSDTMLMVIPRAAITANVPSRMMGRPATVTRVLRRLRKKANTTRDAARAPISSSRIASLNVSRTKIDWSCTATRLRSGRSSPSAASSAFTRSATCTVLVPDCLRTEMITASCPFNRL